MGRWVVFTCATLLAICSQTEGRVFLTQQQAIDAAFPAPQKVQRRTIYLSAEQTARAAQTAGVPVEARIVIYYVGTLEGEVTGYAYFDTHLVRTLPETILIRVSPAARIEKIDIVSFGEPEDYLPSGRWLEQFSGAALDPDLSMKSRIRVLAGATLSARAVTQAARRVLALHRMFVAREEPAPEEGRGPARETDP